MRWWFFTFVALCAVSSRLPAENSKPNIIFILTDDLGWGDVGFHGGDAETPHLDQLASEGVELTSHYVAPVCSPTRTGLLTGRNWTRFGVTTPTNTLAIPLTTITLPRLLAEQGYDTCLIGKWHLGSLPKWGPNHFGFNHSYGSLAGGVSPWSHGYKQGIYRPTWHRNEELIQEGGHVTDLLTEEAIDWIGKRRDRPFFMYLPYTAV
ncbi:MAG: sulfatase-like hydrolase/transferase, partial [Planctomycetota bacterium]|nr:sulfatase-like hydrolase/transferase [Planctomycetota bacterium]